jgi:GTP cyclohydrolase II
LLDLPSVEHRLATDRGSVRVVVQPPTDLDIDKQPIAAFVIGDPTDRCLVRLHSRCLYGEVMGSHQCDCRTQLHTSLTMMQDEGAGVLVYLDQEGRGAGLLAKAIAYRLHETDGVDTFTAYEQRGYPIDMRSYDLAARMLQRLGLRSVRLLTNNPDKVAGLKNCGIEVERLPLVCDVAPEAMSYIESKRSRGHLFDDVIPPPASTAMDLIVGGPDVAPDLAFYPSKRSLWRPFQGTRRARRR